MLYMRPQDDYLYNRLTMPEIQRIYCPEAFSEQITALSVMDITDETEEALTELPPLAMEPFCFRSAILPDCQAMAS